MIRRIADCGLPIAECGTERTDSSAWDSARGSANLAKVCANLRKVAGCPLPPRFVLALIALFAFALPAFAQTALKAELTPLMLRLKPDTATPALVEIKHYGLSLLEGTLEVRLRDGADNRLATARITDLAIAPGGQAFNITLPAVSSYGNMVYADMLFRTSRAAYFLGTRQLMIADPASRTLTVGLIQGDERPDEKLFDVIRSLRLDRFDPAKDAPEARPGARLISTQQAALHAADAPAAPLAYCCFDAVCVTPRGFCLLRERQLDALLTWVKAGGSLCVFPGGDMKEYHLDFLNKLAGGERYELNEQGAVVGVTIQAPQTGHSERSEESSRERASLGKQTLRSAQSDTRTGAGTSDDDLAASGVFMRRVELGRAVIALAPAPAQELAWPGWRPVTAFLWKARQAQLAEMTGKDLWNANQIDYARAEQYRYLTYQRVQRPGGQPESGTALVSAAPVALEAKSSLAQTLAPSDVRVIPFWLVGLLLFGFLALIGPADYFVLGALRKRKYTWFTLPTYCVAFTVLFIGLSRHYIGSQDHRRALVIQDEDADGNVLRSTRIEMIFTAGSRRVVSPATNALAATVSVRGQRYYGEEGDSTTPPEYVGRYPSSYQLEKQMQQWTYTVYRFLSMGGSGWEGRLTGRASILRRKTPSRASATPAARG